MDPDSDPDPAISVIDLQDASKYSFFPTIFSAYYFLKVHLHHFSKIKSQKESQNSRNQGFSHYFCMMIEGSGSGPGRPKNMWIRIRYLLTSRLSLVGPTGTFQRLSLTPGGHPPRPFYNLDSLCGCLHFFLCVFCRPFWHR
jgi:hypothetical protein